MIRQIRVEIAFQGPFQYIATRFKSQFPSTNLQPALNTLVTGGNGFIGSHLVEHLLKRGNVVRCLVRRTSDLKWLNGLAIEYVYGDLFDPAALRDAVKGMDIIYHSAGVTKAKRRDEYYRGNRDGTRNILDAVVSDNPGLNRFVHISSQAAVGPSPSITPIDETVAAHPLTTYGKSKWEAEQQCHQFMDRIPITIVRPPAVYGPRDKDVFEFFNTMSKGLQPMIGFRDKYVSLIHVTDLVRGFIMAGESDRASGETYFISSKRVYNWKELGDITRTVLGNNALRIRIPEVVIFGISAAAEFVSLFSRKPALLNIEKGRDIVQNYWTCDSAKAKADFGFEENFSIEDGIRETIAWYRKKNWLSQPA